MARAIVNPLEKQFGDKSSAATKQTDIPIDRYRRLSEELTKVEIMVITAKAKLDKLREANRPEELRAIKEAEIDLASKAVQRDVLKSRLDKLGIDVKGLQSDRQKLEYAKKDLRRAESILDKINSDLAASLSDAKTGKASTVFVPLFRSQSFGRDITLALTERVIQRVQQRTSHKIVASLEDADAVLEGSVSADANGDLSLTTKWTDTRTKKVVVMKTVFTPGPTDVPGQVEAFSEFIVDGMKLLR